MGLTKDQQKALDCCLDGKNIFITGGGGVGKTYLIHKIVDCLKESGRSVMLTAPTGRAAQLIGGATSGSYVQVYSPKFGCTGWVNAGFLA